MLKLLNKISFVLVMFAVSLPGVTVAKQINAAGASFPYPIYNRWFDEFHKETGIKINYQSVGSGAGIRQVIAGTVDFGASDAPMKDKEIAKALKKNKKNILHIPTVLGAVVVSYNLTELKAPLRLKPEVVADIFLGNIKQWDDARIAESNPDVKLPNKPIHVVHRSDGSGTTAVFTDALFKASDAWKKVGAGKAVRWPTGIGAKGNEGVAGYLKKMDGAIGYLEYIYAKNNDLPVAHVQNKSGAYVAPSIETVSEAAASFINDIPEDFRIKITYPGGNPKAYPIASFTFLLVNKELYDNEHAGDIVKFLHWAMDKGQKIAPELAYAPLPEALVGRVKKTIDSIQIKPSI